MPHPLGMQTLINYKSCAISVQVAPFLWKGEDASRDLVDPTRPEPTTHSREQHPVNRGAKDNLPPPELQALLTESPFVVLTQIFTFALELETRIIKPQVSKHNRLVLVLLVEAGTQNTFVP